MPLCSAYVIDQRTLWINVRHLAGTRLRASPDRSPIPATWIPMYSHRIWRFLFHRVPFREKARMDTPFASHPPLVRFEPPGCRDSPRRPDASDKRILRGESLLGGTCGDEDPISRNIRCLSEPAVSPLVGTRRRPYSGWRFGWRFRFRPVHGPGHRPEHSCEHIKAGERLQ